MRQFLQGVLRRLDLLFSAVMFSLPGRDLAYHYARMMADGRLRRAAIDSDSYIEHPYDVMFLSTEPADSAKDNYIARLHKGINERDQMIGDLRGQLASAMQKRVLVLPDEWRDAIGLFNAVCVNGHGWVYFIGNIEAGYVKIGHSQDPAQRILGIQTGCPFDVAILAAVPGSLKTETALHERFAHLRSRAGGEWFTIDEDLKKHIMIAYRGEYMKNFAG